ncbi:tyrosine-type recombinase/integrase, partial [Desulfovibrio sp. OttesenSCG-928-C14]|nr:tyrosine-type recombinase/integrase [Desulfovibrio sp. OttesenSCG-928-C14]
TTRNGDDLLFYTTIRGSKGAMSPDNAGYFMKRYGQQAKSVCPSVPNRVHPHQLRHTRAIHLYRGGMPLALLSEFLGHACLTTTQVYAYADTDMKRKAIEKIYPQSGGADAEAPIWKDDEEMLRKLYGLA